MPHLILEYSSGLVSREKMQEVCVLGHQTLQKSGQFTPGAIKVRAKDYEVYAVTEAASRSPFLHVTLYLLAGRAVSVRAQIADSLHAAFREVFPDLTHLSVDIQEMNAETYRK